jgi:sugar lactone lactonase YvrE
MKKGPVEVKIACDTVAGIGEGAIWDYKYNRLLWIDTQGSVFIFTPSDGKNREIKLGKLVGTVVPYQQNSVIVALEDGIYELDLETEKLTFICQPENPLIKTNKYNDGKCDSKGRLWVGTMDINTEQGRGGFYCVNGNGEYQKILKNVSISNGVCWSLDNKKMYYQDSPLRTVSAFDFDIDKGSISEREEIIKLPKGVGDPDGNTLDATGMVWIAHWGGACVSKWNPHTGQMLQKIDVPACNVTSVAFGGPTLEDLYITTASLYAPEEKKSLYPDQGKLFVCQPGVKGIKANYFSK